MDWFKKHVDTVIILGAFASAIFWMNGRFNEVDKKFYQVDKQFADVYRHLAEVRQDIDRQFAEVHQELAVMKTVLIMKKIMPIELAQATDVE